MMINKDWMEKCITAGELLYGEFPMSVFHQMYATKAEPVGTSTVMESYDDSLMMLCDGKMFTPYIATEGELLQIFKEADESGNPYASIHFDLTELKALRNEHKSVEELEYWIPTAKQIEELVDKSYIRTPEMTALEKEIRRLGGDPEFLTILWQEVSTGKTDMNDAVNDILQKIAGTYPNGAPTLEQLNANLRSVQEFVNMVNRRDRKGWPPKELFKKQFPHGMMHMPTIVPGSAQAAQLLKQSEPQLKAMGADVDYSSIDTFATVGQYGERKILKVGRNDPCPCGSGKKYKQCHGRNIS